MLAFRSDLTQCCRDYFLAEGLYEIATPVVRFAGTSEVHLENLRLDGSEGSGGYLQTSPEYAMKIALARHGQSIFQICPAIRGGETGARHSVEFQMLEWYRLGYTLKELADDLGRLLHEVSVSLASKHPGVSTIQEINHTTYRALFESVYGINPHAADRTDLDTLAANQGLFHLTESDGVGDMLDGLFSSAIEPRLEKPTLVFDYPASQAALAEVLIDQAGDLVARRFELFAGGFEIANAYQELDDPIELKRRFAVNNEIRKSLGKALVPDDQELLSVTGSIGTYAGIALGMDRFAMYLLGASDIASVSV